MKCYVSSRIPSKVLCRVPLLFTPQPECGFTVTCPALPELVTEGDSLAEALANAQDALAAVIELYSDEGRPLPSSVASPAARHFSIIVRNTL
jgi:antitoxin HicB